MEYGYNSFESNNAKYARMKSIIIIIIIATIQAMEMKSIMINIIWSDSFIMENEMEK